MTLRSETARQWRLFTDPFARALPAGGPRAAAQVPRGAAARGRRARPQDPRPAALVAELRAASPLFERLWADHEVAVRRSDVKRLLHPVVGELQLDCEVLLSADGEQRLVVFTARPGSESHDRLRLLQVVGLQDLTVS